MCRRFVLQNTTKRVKSTVLKNYCIRTGIKIKLLLARGLNAWNLHSA